MKHLLALLLLLASPLAAETPMSAAEFDSYSRGKTFYYGSATGPYGAEQYFENNRVLWSFLDGKCKEGTWYEDNNQICFTYEDNPDPQCWSFYQSPNGLIARFENDPTQTELYEVRNAKEPMLCYGPEVGA